MSGNTGGDIARTAVPIADLSALDRALRGDDDALKAALKKLRPADVGRDLSRRSISASLRLVKNSDDRSAAAMLRTTHPSVAAKVIERLDPEHARRVLTLLAADHQVAIAAALDATARQRIEAVLTPDERAHVDRVLAYPETAVARLMTPMVWKVRLPATVADALDALRKDGDAIDAAQNCYVVDDNGKPVGVMALRELAVADPATSVDDLMTRDVIAVAEDAGKGDAAEIIQTHDFLTLPVVDKSGVLRGVVRVDDLLDAALARDGVSILNQGGVSGRVAASEPYFQTSMARVVRSRLTWLVLLFVAETATGTVLRHFEGELQRVVALSFFIPLLIGTGGNAGSQTVSTVIRALAVGEVRLGDAARVLLKESSTGLVLGLLLGAVAFVRALMWGVHTDVAGCVAVTIVVVCTWANTVGSLIPLGAQRVGVDPTVVSGPLITTLVDASGLFLYLSIAHLMVAQLQGP